MKPKSFFQGGCQPMPFENLTKIEGPLIRHIEQLWDEINKLKQRINELESKDKSTGN